MDEESKIATLLDGKGKYPIIDIKQHTTYAPKDEIKQAILHMIKNKIQIF